MPEIFNRLFRKTAVLADQALEQFPLLDTIHEQSYRAAVHSHRASMPALSAVDAAIVESLETDGAVVTSLDELGIPGTARLLDAAQKLVPQVMGMATPKNGYYTHATPAQIMAHPDIFLWGLNERLLRIAENYIRLPVSYQGSFYSRNLANGQEIGSRLWHLDLEDYRSFKLIVYLHDVFEDGGPFQYVPKTLTHQISGALQQKYAYGQTKRFKADVMEDIVPAEDWRLCGGPAGTVVIADTSSIFHRGVVPEAQDRLAIFFEYLSKQPKRPHYCKKLLSQGELDQITRGLTPYQIECAAASQFSTLTRLPK